MINNIIAMTICVILSAYFSATETAFSALNKTRLRAMAENGNRKAALTLRLSENYDKLISTILIGNNIVNIAVASIGTVMFINLLQDEQMGTTVSTVVVTLVVLIFGEITPKSIAKDYPENFAMFSSPILKMIIWVFTPLNFLFSKWKQMVSKLFRSDNDPKMSQEEFLILLDEVQQQGAIGENESQLLKNAVEFGDMGVQDVLTPRMDLVGIPLDAKSKEVADIFDQCSFSRLPVYEESMDNIVGIVHRMDFYTGGGVTEKTLEEIMTAPLFIHQTEKIGHLLQMFRSTKAHLAVVLDEYGGTLGIVTMEDILEELVGEIWDEHDEVEEPVHSLEEDKYLVDGSWSLDDFCRKFHVETDSDNISVGGWVMDKIGRIPEEGDYFQYGRLEITVHRVDDRRVESIFVVENDLLNDDE